MFNDKQIQALTYEIDKSRIKSRNKGNISLLYLEGHDILETANRIFGYGNWNYTITTLEQVSQEVNTNQNHVICYKAVVQIVVHDTHHTKSIHREDVGFGSGIAKTLADAHESAAKEAVTDAIKRTMRSFGNQFGNSLYDKSRQHNASPNQQQLIPPSNASQNAQQIPTTQTPPNQNPQSYSNNPSPNQLLQEYASLYNLGLQVVDNHNGYLIINGDDIFSKKDSIKACGFRWDSSSKVWYKAIEQQQVA